MKREVQGNLTGIKQHTLQELQNLYTYSIERNVLLSSELLQELVHLSSQIAREIAIYINRRGQVVQVAVGDSSTVSMPEVKGRLAEDSLSGIRCVHTHPTGDAQLSLLDLTSLVNLRLDCMVAIGMHDTQVNGLQVAYLQPVKGKLAQNTVIFDLTPDELEHHPVNTLVETLDKQIVQDGFLVAATAERAILVGVDSGNSGWSAQDSLLELAELGASAGATVVAQVVQKRQKPDTATYVGFGKANDLASLVQELDANCIIFDDELTPAQNRNLEQLINCK
ncbi:MAG: hypothetical protein M0Z55_07280, partial [Peptococcaceae bacterium]|nr:hypothetical protein [Peptococcaceae bacterium]